MAANDSQQKHKPGPLKQQNKPHKHGRHRTKGQVDNDNKGKVEVKALTKKKKQLDKHQRRHQAKQIRKNKHEEVIEKKRKLGIEHTPPHVIALCSLSPLCNCEEALNNIAENDDSIISFAKNNITTIISTRHRQRYTIVQPSKGDLFSVLDAAKIADSFLFLITADGVIDEFSQKCLTCLTAQGLPATIHAVQGLKHVSVRKQSDAKKNIHKQLGKWFPDIKLHSMDCQQDAGIILRVLTNQKQKCILYREQRSYLLSDTIEFQHENNEDINGVLKVSGYIRGRPLSVNGLVHLPGLGDFQMNQIDLPKDPYIIKKKADKNSNSMTQEDDLAMEEDIKIIATADPSKQESPVPEAEVDPMDGEQTWPTEEELHEAEEAAAFLAEDEEIGKGLKKVHKGTSGYQATWIVDHEDEQGSEDDNDDDDEEEEEEDSDAMAGSDNEEDAENEEFDTISVSATTIANDERYDESFDMDEEQKQLEKYRLERDNEMFPDEVDTPMHIPARERFQRYRGLKSFHASPWDPKENLPLDYARIFQFQNFNRTKKKVLNSDGDIDGALTGWYVTIHICNVPKVYFENWNSDQPMVIFGLLPHEQKMTVMHYTIKRHQAFDAPVKAKERLVFHVGYRRFNACSIFSQHTTGDKFKAERFLPHGTVTIATVYAPIMFPPSPVLVFTEDHQLVATGIVLTSNPNRIVVKKTILSGHPFKIHKKSSVVRYMFFSRDDVLWFKPVELFTKFGRRGHIKEPLGTHGHMKCVFNGQLKAQDTVCMNLFKRIYPKWTYDPCVSTPKTVTYDTPTNNDDVEM